MEIRHFQDDYYISSTGELFKKLKPQKSRNGYMEFKDKWGEHHLIHRIVAKLFLPKKECDYILDVNHKDGNRENNDVNNLEWCTRSENLRHSFEELGQTPIRYFQRCELFYNDKFVRTFETKREASKYASLHGAKYSMMEKHRRSNGWEIRCIDYPKGE